jgi:hypothetical protein
MVRRTFAKFEGHRPKLSSAFLTNSRQNLPKPPITRTRDKDFADFSVSSLVTMFRGVLSLRP